MTSSPICKVSSLFFFFSLSTTKDRSVKRKSILCTSHLTYISYKLLAVFLHKEKFFSESQLFSSELPTPYQPFFNKIASLVTVTIVRLLNCNETDGTLFFSSNSLNFNLETYLRLLPSLYSA